MRGKGAVSAAIVGLVLITLSAPPAQAAPDVSAPVSARSRLDRPAIWVADRVTFSVDIECARDYDILPEDVSREKLSLAPGLDLIASDVQREAHDGATHYTVRYVLTPIASMWRR